MTAPPGLDEVDAELLKALRVIRGDHDNKTGKSSQISQAIVSAIQIQGKDLTDQNAELLDAVKKQNILLENLAAVLSKKQQTQTVVVPQQEMLRSVPKTKKSSVPKEEVVLTDTIDYEPKKAETQTGVFVALDKADSDEEEAAAAASTARSTPINRPSGTRERAVVAAAANPKEKKGGKKVVTGPWAFVETNVALRRRGRVENSDVLDMEDSLFGKSNSTADVLSGDSFGKSWDRMRNPVDQYGKLKPPKWSSLDKKKSIRTYLPKLAIGGETQIKLNTGVYYLTVKYSNDQIAEDNEAAIIIGEIAFDNRGFVLAAGADWNKLFGGQKQLEAPSASGNKAGGKLKWHSSKVSEAWKDGDTLKFKIDTTTNTLGYTIQGVDDKDVRTGWMFANVLAFTNNKMYPQFLNVFAYAGGTSMHAVAQGKETSFAGIKFSLKETLRSRSVLNLKALAEDDDEE